MRGELFSDMPIFRDEIFVAVYAVLYFYVTRGLLLLHILNWVYPRLSFYVYYALPAHAFSV